VASCFVDTSLNPPALDCNLCVNGRRPQGMKRARVSRRASPLGRHFAHAAHLEAAAVDAFRILREELQAHGAAPELIDAATRTPSATRYATHG
jgi:hypothetical protein